MIADFGLSKIIDKEKFDLLTTTCGTPGYMVTSFSHPLTTQVMHAPFTCPFRDLRDLLH